MHAQTAEVQMTGLRPLDWTNDARMEVEPVDGCPFQVPAARIIPSPNVVGEFSFRLKRPSHDIMAPAMHHLDRSRWHVMRADAVIFDLEPFFLHP